MFPLILGSMIFGGVTKVVGNVKANAAQAAAEEANAAWYQEQAEFARQSTSRSLTIFRDEAEDFRSKQVGAVARGGVTLSGSPLLALMDTSIKRQREEESIIENGRMQRKEALMKAGASLEQAERLTGFWNNALPALGVAFDVTGKILEGKK